MPSTQQDLPLNRLVLKNRGCFREASIDFSPLTVIVGENDTGKTTLLHAIEELSQSTYLQQGWSGVFLGNSLRAATFGGRDIGPLTYSAEGFNGSQPYEYKVSVGQHSNRQPVILDEIADLGHFQFVRGTQGRASTIRVPNEDRAEVTLPGGDAVPFFGSRPTYGGQGTDAFKKVMAALNHTPPRIFSARRFRLLPERLRSPVPVASRGQLEFDGSYLIDMASDGFGLPRAVVDVLLRERKTVELIEREMRAWMPHVAYLGARHIMTSEAGHDTSSVLSYEPEITTTAGTQVPGPRISDGVLLTIAYLVLTLSMAGPAVLMIEEPEVGIHVGLLAKLVDLFRDLTSREHRRIQIVLTTHSVPLLNQVAPSSIRAVVRDRSGESTIVPFPSLPDVAAQLESLPAGEIWSSIRRR